MKAVIDLSEVEDQLKNCKPGDQYSITFTVAAKTPDELDGTASEIEHMGDEENYSEDNASDEESPEEPMPKGKRVPKAILMIAK